MSNSELVSRASTGTGPLLERVRRALAHDLRTPLGTIGNYATILEYHDQAKPEEVRAFATRIRASVARTSLMLTQLTDALTLVTRKPSGKRSEPASILIALLAELGVQAQGPSLDREPRGFADVDPDLLRFCWHAFLVMHVQTAPEVGLDLDVTWNDDGSDVIVDLWLSKERDVLTGERIDPSAYAPRTEAPPQDARFSLTLAEDLVTARNGSLEILGRDNVPTHLRLRMPRSR
ncbi:MAG TPA: histidine kinase dimerization/phospho-acceptor domain-containing protein [Planctomycetota bacterium]|nr:histidine kinase dimerization/phospho-acceptor domain-containing protein [Planctomycetota bacterium]